MVFPPQKLGIPGPSLSHHWQSIVYIFPSIFSLLEKSSVRFANISRLCMGIMSCTIFHVKRFRVCITRTFLECLTNYREDDKKYDIYSQMTQSFSSLHGMFLEWWNRTKSLSSIWNHFSCLLDQGTPKIWKKLNSHGGFLRAD